MCVCVCVGGVLAVQARLPGPTALTFFFFFFFLKKGICKNGNNYLGEIIGLEITLKYLAEEAEVSNRSIHIFTDCQSAIESVFGNGIPSYKVDTVLFIRRISSYLKDRGNSVVVHWIWGHKGFVGNELADSLAKEAAKGITVKTSPSQNVP